MLERLQEARKSQDGFTLIELLMVIVILGILAGIVVFAVNGINNRGAQAACQADVKTVSVAAEAAYAQNSSYPADLPGLVSAGFLHSAPADVSYSATPTTITTLQGTGACAGYKG